MIDETKNAPKVEPGGQQEPEPKDITESLRSDIQAVEDAMVQRVVDKFRAGLNELKQPDRSKVPAPDVKEKDSGIIRVTGEGVDPLYRNLPDFQKPYRTPQIDRLSQKWMRAVAIKDFEAMRSLERELNDLVRANEVTEGTAASDGGIGSGTGAALIPRPLANVIAEVRNRRAKIRQRAQVFVSPNQTLTIPIGNTVSAEVVAEGSTASNSAAGITYVNLSKKKLQAKFSLTLEFLADHNSAFNAVDYFVRRAGGALGQLEDEEFIAGTNISRGFEEIQGETIILPATAGRLSYGDVNSLFYGLGEQYRDNAVFAGNANALKLLSALTDGNGRPIFNPITMMPQALEDPITGNASSLMRRQVWELPFTTSGTSSNLVDVWFFDPVEYAILDGGSFTVSMSEHAGFDDDTLRIKITERVDGYPMVAEAFARLMAVSGTLNGSTVDTFL